MLACVLLGGMLFMSSCNKEATYDYPLADQQLCIDAQQFASGTGFESSFTIPQADLKALYGASKELRSMTAKGFKLKVSASGSAVNFDKISGAQVYIKPVSASGDGTQIASTNSAFAAGTTEVDMAVSGTELKELMGSGEDLKVTLRVFNKDNSPQTCITLTKGSITLKSK